RSGAHFSHRHSGTRFFAGPESILTMVVIDSGLAPSRRPGMATKLEARARIPAARNVRALPVATLEKQRVQGMPGARRTHCLACNENRRTQANTGTPKSPGTPCAMVLRLLRALPGVPGLLAPVAAQ